MHRGASILLLIPYIVVCCIQTKESQTGFSIYSSDQAVALDIPWTNLNGASCPITGSRATCATFSQTFSEFFEVRSFNFSIPENSNITSLSVSLQVQVDGEMNPRTREVEVALFRDGGNTKFSTLIIPYASTEGWNLTTGAIVYPQISEDPLWGTQWNASDINSSNFGLSTRIENPSGADIDAYIQRWEESLGNANLILTSYSSTGDTGAVTIRSKYGEDVFYTALNANSSLNYFTHMHNGKLYRLIRQVNIGLGGKECVHIKANVDASGNVTGYEHKGRGKE